MTNLSKSTRSRKVWLWLTVSLIVAACLFVALPWLRSRSQSLTTAVSSSQTLLPGDRVRVPVFVRDSVSGKPVSGAEVLAWAKLDPSGKSIGTSVDFGEAMPRGSVILARTRSDAQGVATLDVTAPSQGTGTIMADTSLGLDQDRTGLLYVRTPVLWPLVTTDRPSYRPGDAVRMRVLLLDEARRPVKNAKLELRIEGTASHATCATSSFGTATTEVKLPAGTKAGTHGVTVNGSSAAQIDVTEREPPRLRVGLELAPIQFEQPLRGVVTVREPSGRPLVGTEVRIFASEYFALPVTKSTPGPTAQGTTNDQGKLAFSVDRDQWRKWRGYCHAVAIVTDTRFGEERAERRIRLPARQGSAIQAVPEQQTLVPGVENTVFVRVTDGATRAFDGTIEVDGGKLQGSLLDSLGFSAVVASPRSMERSWSATVRVTAPPERVGSKKLELYTDGPESILIRPNQSIYRVGERLKVTLLSPTPGTVWVALMRQYRVLDGAKAELRDGVAKLDFSVADKLVGPVRIYASRDRLSLDQEPPLPGWSLGRRWIHVENVRQVFVDSAEEIMLRVDGDRPAYAPGDVAKLRVRVERADRSPVAASVFLTSVDSSDVDKFAVLPGDDRARLADSSRFCDVARKWSPDILLQPGKAGGDLQAAFALAGGTAQGGVSYGPTPWRRRQLHLATSRQHLILVGLGLSFWTLLLGTMAIVHAVRRQKGRGAGVFGIALTAAAAAAAWSGQAPLRDMVHQEEPRVPGRAFGHAPGPRDEPRVLGDCSPVWEVADLPPPVVWFPELLVDATGTKVIELPIPEAIGTHVVSASAVTAEGKIATARMKLEIR